MKDSLSKEGLNQLFLEARSYNSFEKSDISQTQLKEIYNLAKLSPTSANSKPGRFCFIHSPEGHERLKPYLAPGNVAKSMSAPVIAIAAFDPNFYDKIPQLFPHNPAARDWYAKAPDKGYATGLMNATLDAAFFIMAARALGYDTGPMGGFDNKGVDKEFFSESGFKSIFLISIGIGVKESIFPRLPRLDFEQACEII